MLKKLLLTFYRCNILDVYYKKAKDGDFFVTDGLRNRNTLEYLGIWERMYNPDFNYGEFAIIRNKAGLNSFKISVKEFVAKTNAISLEAKTGRYGGTYAHKDIPFEFAMWISPEFKIYIVKEFQRMKAEEQKQIAWTAKRELSKINYRIHTDAIKSNLIHQEVTAAQASIIYAEEADVLNVALFGMTAKEWREANPEQKGNIRDYATVNELICLSNMENINAVLINDGISQDRSFSCRGVHGCFPIVCYWCHRHRMASSHTIGQTYLAEFVEKGFEICIICKPLH